MARGNPRWLCAGSKAPTVRGGFGGPAAGVSRDRGHGTERKRLGDRTGTGPARVSSVQVIGEAGFAPSGAIISRVPVTIPSRGGIGLRESAAAAAGVALRPQAAAPSDRQSTSRAADGGASTHQNHWQQQPHRRPGRWAASRLCLGGREAADSLGPSRSSEPAGRDHSLPGLGKTTQYHSLPGRGTAPAVPAASLPAVTALRPPPAARKPSGRRPAGAAGEKNRDAKPAAGTLQCGREACGRRRDASVRKTARSPHGVGAASARRSKPALAPVQRSHLCAGRAPLTRTGMPAPALQTEAAGGHPSPAQSAQSPADLKRKAHAVPRTGTRAHVRKAHTRATRPRAHVRAHLPSACSGACGAA